MLLYALRTFVAKLLTRDTWSFVFPYFQNSNSLACRCSFSTVINSCQFLLFLYFVFISLFDCFCLWSFVVTHCKCPWVCERHCINQMWFSNYWCTNEKSSSECYWLAQMCRFCLLCKILFKMLQVFKNLQLFMEDKEPEDDLFDRLNVSHRFHQSVIYCLELRQRM